MMRKLCKEANWKASKFQPHKFNTLRAHFSVERKQSYYKILDLDENADIKEIKVAFKKKGRSF